MDVQEEQEEEVRVKDLYADLCRTHFEERGLPFLRSIQFLHLEYWYWCSTDLVCLLLGMWIFFSKQRVCIF